jgi:urease gamma subunit
MTKGKAPAAMTMIQLNEEQREAVAIAEFHRRTSRVKGVTLHHPHQVALMATAVVVAAQPGQTPIVKVRRIRSCMMHVPT